MAPELVIFIGLQASGKTSLYHARFAETHVHVSKDLLRNARGREARQTAAVAASLSSGCSVVVDNTNPGIADRAALIALGRRFDAAIAGYYFASEPAACRRRNALRQGRARVPDVAIFSTLRPPAASDPRRGVRFAVRRQPPRGWLPDRPLGGGGVGMERDSYEARMRALEYFSGQQLLPGVWAVIRVDGNRFSRLTERRFTKPFDAAFHQLMLHTATALLGELQGLYAYTGSDEISVLCAPGWNHFDRRLEKVVSVSRASPPRPSPTERANPPTLTAEYGSAPARICSLTTSAGGRRTSREARSTTGATGPCGIPAAASPKPPRDSAVWQRRRSRNSCFNTGSTSTICHPGSGGARHCGGRDYEREGYDPQQDRAVTVVRRRIAVDIDLPMRDGYSAYLRTLLLGARAAPGA